MKERAADLRGRLRHVQLIPHAVRHQLGKTPMLTSLPKALFLAGR